MAELIVELVKNGVKIVVNSHSPYMIEALERYSEKSDIVSDFYLAEDGFISKVDDSNSKTLSKIFSKLSEPFDEFEKMDSEILQGG
jgi:predicted ATPase